MWMLELEDWLVEWGDLNAAAEVHRSRQEILIGMQVEE